MNFMQAAAVSERCLNIAGRYFLDCGAPKLQAGEQLEIAFRPESVKLALQADLASGQLNLPVRILNMEFLGAKRRLFCALNLQDQASAAQVRLQVDIENQQLPHLAEEMWLQVPLSALHIFDLQGWAKC